MINTFRTLFEARERKFQQERLFRGESVDLVAKITTDGVLDTLSGYSISGVYQPTDDLSGDIYSVDAEIVDGKAILHWTNDNDFGKDSYNVWGLLAKDGKAAYPICWRLMFAHSPSYPLGTPDPIPRTIDFSQYELLNAPWLPLSGGTLSGRIYYDIEEPVQITNLSSWIGDATGLGRGIITIYNETENTLDDKYSQEGATLSGRWDNMWNPPNPTGPLVFPENPQEGDVFEPYAAMDGEYLNGKDVTFSKGTVLIANPGWETKEVPCFKIHVVYTYIYHNGEGWVPRSENDWCICKINGEWQAASFARGFTAYDSLVWHEFSEGGTEPREPDPFVLSSEIADLATKQYVQESIASIPTPELADFATYEYVDGKFETKIDADETKIELDSKIATKVSKEELSAELSNYATNSFVNDSFNNARTYTDEQIDWLSNVYTKTDVLTATYETKQHAADTYHTKADAVADSTYLNGRIDGVETDLSTNYATKTYVQEYVAEHGGGGSPANLSACLSSAEFSAITELANDGSASLSSIVDKLDEVIRALKRVQPEPPIPPTPTYVDQDMIAWWDGIDNIGTASHSDSTTTWKDLKGSNDLKYNGSVDTLWDENAFNFNGTYAFFSTNSSIPAQTANKFTAEVVYSMTTPIVRDKGVFGSRYNGSGYGIYGPNYYNRIQCGIGSDANDFNSTNTPALTAINAVGMHHVAITYDKDTNTMQVFHNGQFMNSRTVTETLNGNVTTYMIGRGFTENVSGSQSNRTFVGKVYSHRVYSRVLTNQEIASNYQVDVQRFNIV